MKIRPSTTENTLALWGKSLLNAALFFLVFMVLLPLLANRLGPQALPLVLPLRAGLGAAFFSLGIGVWLWCLDSFSRQGRGTPFPLDAPRLLVTSGAFAVVRNPIIGAEILVVWGEVIYFATTGMVFYGCLATVAAQLVVVGVEEPELRGRFGEQYERYCREVPRWFPRLRRGG